MVVILVICILFFISGPGTGILAFFIPVVVGAHVTMQGNEKKYAFYLSGFSLCVIIFLLATEIRIGNNSPLGDAQITVELLQNFIGSAFATLFEVVFLLKVSNKLQNKLYFTANLLKENNKELSLLLKSNTEQNKQISQQLEQIRKADVELQKLSLIATQTKNVVIISDALGRIEWVNMAFNQVTGWTLEEIIGKKPKDFLTRKVEGEEISKSISEKLSKKEFVKETIINYAKDGTPYYNQIEITPIFDEAGNHTNFISLQRDITTEINYQKALEQLNERYELVVNKVTNDLIWEWDFNDNNPHQKENLSSIFGHTFNDKNKQIDWSENCIHSEDRKQLLNKIENCLSEKIDTWEHEYRYLDTDGTSKIYLDRGYIIFDETELPIRMIGAISDVTEKRKLEKELNDQKIQQQKLIAQIAIQSQEKEKNEVATELHENINQILAVAKMNLDFFNRDLPDADKYIKKSHDNIERALQEIRKLSHSLATPSLNNYDPIEAIKELINDYASKGDFKVEFLNTLNTSIQLSDEIKLTIYRIAQEQLNNVFKHAKATDLIIKIYSDNEGVSFSIIDNGIGFTNNLKSIGMGLKNIENRVKLHSGKMTLDTDIGKGCRLDIFLPL